MESVEVLLEKFKSGEISLEATAHALRQPRFDDLGYAKLDFHRETRRGCGEVIFCPGKTNDQLVGILNAFHARGCSVMGSRCSQEQYDYVKGCGLGVQYDECSKLLIYVVGEIQPDCIGCVAVCTGGTADLPVAEEAAQTAEFFGAHVDRHFDVGVAGIQRLLDRIEDIRKANAIIAVAGMEGALGTVIAGLVDVPIIAVPTSVGYGASFEGIAPLLTMLNSCAEGLSVVNIDNGYGAGYLAAQINRLVERKR